MKTLDRARSEKEKEEVINRILYMWKKFPDLRLGQLIENCRLPGGTDLFFIEDYELVRMVENKYKNK